MSLVVILAQEVWQMRVGEWVAPSGTLRRKWIRVVANAMGRRPARGAPPVAAKHRRSWKEDPRALDEYLVSGFQNPRINPQSILTRHLIVRELFGSDFDALMDEEFEFCVAAVDVIQKRANELGIKVRSYLDPIKRSSVNKACERISHWEGTFEALWSSKLKSCSAQPLKVLEFGCGSANDYRFFHSYGISRFLDYTGIDRNPIHIKNARMRHPDVRFEVRDVRNLTYKTKSFDYVIASDVFEFLPLSALKPLIADACRIARRGVVLNFFNMSNRQEHDVQRKGSSSKSLLSVQQILALLEKHAGDTTIEHIRTMLRRRFPDHRWPNNRAWTVFAKAR